LASLKKQAFGFFVPLILGPEEGEMDTPSAIMINLPECFGAKEARKLGRELKRKITTGTPCVVVDLSRVKKIDVRGLEGLLACMQEIARHDGALQLGGISPEAAIILELTRMDRLFQKFPTFPADVPSFALSPETSGEEVRSEGAVQPQPVAA
jgi:anti-anti-sigma regulatory factor